MEEHENAEEQTQHITEPSVMTMICPACQGIIKMDNGMMICGCGFAPKHGAD